MCVIKSVIKMGLVSPYKMNSGHNKYNKKVTIVGIRKRKIKGEKIVKLKSPMEAKGLKVNVREK